MNIIDEIVIKVKPKNVLGIVTKELNQINPWN